MRYISLIITLIIILPDLSNGQCPTVGMNLPDSVCGGAPFIINNTSSGGSSHYWDLCSGDMLTAPTSSVIPGTPGLNYPQQIRAVFDNGNYYLFTVNFFGNNINRYDFGGSIDNNPVEFDYGNVGGLFNQPAGLDVVNENGNWYAFVTNIATGHVIRVDLGTNIAANNATATNLGPFGLSSPRGFRMVKDAGSYYAFVSNGGNNDLTKISFGSSVTNTPSGATPLTDPSFDVPWGFEIAYDCSINKWIAFYASNNQSKIHVIDFGSSLANQGTIVSSINCIPNPTGLTMTRDGGKWFLMVNSFTTLEFQKIQIDGNLLNPPSSLVVHGIPSSSSPRNMAVVRTESTFRIFITNNAPSTISKVVFSKPCASVPAISFDPVSVNATLSVINSYQPITLEVLGPNGEIAMFTDSVFIREAPFAGFTSLPGCEGQPVVFTDTSIINMGQSPSWQWNFGDGSPINTTQNPTHTFPANGSYLVTLTTSYASGCSDVVSDSITISPLPSAAFNFINNPCEGSPVSFTDNSLAFGGATLVSWQWDFGDGSAGSSDQNPVHAFNSPGTFTVLLTVTASSGCTDTISSVITVLPAPQNAFTVSSTCVGETVTFSNGTTITGGGSISYNWDFGDSFSSTAIDPTHNYAAIAANYNVTLISTASNGCKDTLIQNIRISNQPVPQFTFSPSVVCEFNPVSFLSTSFGVGGDTISSYLWNFGDGVTSTDKNPFHAYADTGFFSVTLTVVSPTACDSSVTQQIYVIPSPTASFTAAGVCFGLPVSFNPSTTTPPGTQLDSIVWDFGDGTTFTGLTSPTHNYVTPGSYPVTMTVYNDLLCTASYSDTIEVYAIPAAAMSTTFGCSGAPMTFDGTGSSVANDSITSWLWNFAGLGAASGSIVQFGFPNAGNYNVTLIVSSSNGCEDTLVQQAQVVQSPQFDFSFNQPCFGSPSQFTYLPNITPAPSSILTWSFGDGSNSSLLSPSYVYTTVDTFFVSLNVVHNATGCSATVVKPLVVHPYPAAGFTVAENCEGIPVVFADTSTIVAGTIAQRTWNFGSFGTASGAIASVTVPDPGTYPVTLTVESGQGCATTINNTFTVFANPDAAFIPDPLFGSPPLTINFLNSTTGGSTYNWNFGDGGTAIGTSVSHVYQDTGTYQVTMIATSTQGCVDTATGFVYVLIPYLDLAVNKVFVTGTGSLLKITAELVNMGNVPITTFEINGKIENGSVISEQWTGDLQPGVSFLYHFNASYDVSGKALPGYYCVETINPNNDTDQNPSNNSRCGTIGTQLELYSSYPNPFDDGLSVQFNLPDNGNYSVTIHDMAGKLVYSENDRQGIRGYNRLEIVTAAFNKGIYAISLNYRDEIKRITVLKK
jgi:PKD repeat protein